MKTQYSTSKISLAVALGLVAGSLHAQQQDNAIDEVVTTGNRLQGTAAAVIAERKNQAFVADILGSEQISRTGDSDAASALRRVTGLTLVDGKFIYVRGLGERYSSARLNGANIPSPDLTRNVIPLDIFPTNVIESLSVQKAFSPNMPAAFGGGSVDIRTKTLPSEFIAGFQLGIEGNSNNSDGYTYNTNEDGIPDDLSAAIVRYRGDFSFRNIIEKNGLTDTDTQTAFQQAFVANQGLLKSLPRNLTVEEGSLDPNYSFQGNLGNSFDDEWFGGTFGFLASVAYDSKWTYSERTNAVVSADKTDDCSTSFITEDNANNSCYDSLTDSSVTTENERMNGLITLGYRLSGHEVSYSKIFIQDNEDESELGVNQNPSQGITIAVDGTADRDHQFTFEERQLEIDQFKGQHTFLDYWGIGADWQYTKSEVHTNIPLDVTYSFSDDFTDSVYTSSEINGGNGNVNYQFVDMRDFMTSYGGNVSLPISAGDFEIEFKSGWDYSDRARYYTTSSFFINNNGAAINVNNGSDGILGLSSYLSDDFIDNNEVWISFNEPEAPEADDYMAAQKVEAGYGAFDVFYDNTWRISGGLRYEAFKQVTLETSSLIFSREDIESFYSQERIQDRTINEDDFYPSLSLTYIGGEDYQVRFGYGETVVRPDLREVVPVGYFDPLTDIRTTGSLSLTSSQLKNYDARYELYGANGDNLAVSLFYKDIANPIESVLAVGDSSYTASFTNGTSAELYGVEAEWLYDLTFVSDGFFTSGNITLSDSEVIVEAADAGNLTNKVKRMNGHSQYVLNLQLNYDSANGEHSGSLVYNVSGERILASGIGGRGDAFEQPFHSLDLIYTWYPDFNTKVKFKVKNLMGENQEVIQDDVAVRSREIGSTFGVSYSYEF
ncbi:TonB-dependent receptor [Paraglaciecola aquimarina]|uniref:TonB-dependent receptor n=1 Tax=Paraglaciecola aquimarina TaxID=1235557 RepID=A0ABU3SWA9_9ALTE|nr:TonB-dependent receptor [Paraglaciecola aquimarina]MDU0354289.1 TonB-dependent receptor [Paraglaciecola aquimarina]